jgi:hypothetical protein
MPSRFLARIVDLEDGRDLAIRRGEGGRLELVRLDRDQVVAALALDVEELPRLAGLCDLALVALRPPAGARAPGPGILGLPSRRRR